MVDRPIGERRFRNEERKKWPIRIKGPPLLAEQVICPLTARLPPLLVHHFFNGMDRGSLVVQMFRNPLLP